MRGNTTTNALWRGTKENLEEIFMSTKEKSS